MSLPMSLRTAHMEQNYQNAKAGGTTTPLENVTSLQMFQHWRIIDNDFPYTVGYKRCHMLVVKRAGAGSWHDLNDAEITELNELKRTHLYDEYDQIIENCPSRRSVPHLFHLHLVNFYDDRAEMSL